MKLYLTIDKDGAALWNKKPEFDGEAYFYDNSSIEPAYFMLDLEYARALTQNATEPCIKRVELNVLDEKEK